MRIEPWNVVFLIGFIVYVWIRHVFIRRTKSNEKAISRLDARERTLMLLVMPGALLLPVVYLFTPWLAFADYRLPAFAPWCGTILLVAALWLFWRSHADLGQNWSVTLELRKGHQLVKHGVYHDSSSHVCLHLALSLGRDCFAKLAGGWLLSWRCRDVFCSHAWRR
jgi:protein-S-isoprenylcysteine O-methyltransferase Ste14